jgi:hypothetical protein
VNPSFGGVAREPVPNGAQVPPHHAHEPGHFPRSAPRPLQRLQGGAHLLGAGRLRAEVPDHLAAAGPPAQFEIRPAPAPELNCDGALPLEGAPVVGRQTQAGEAVARLAVRGVFGRNGGHHPVLRLS